MYGAASNYIHFLYKYYVIFLLYGDYVSSPAILFYQIRFFCLSVIRIYVTIFPIYFARFFLQKSSRRKYQRSTKWIRKKLSKYIRCGVILVVWLMTRWRWFFLGLTRSLLILRDTVFTLGGSIGMVFSCYIYHRNSSATR